MRGSLGRFASTNSSNCGKQNLLISSSAFSTFAGGGGRGRGRGRGSGSSSSPNPSQFTAQTPGKPDTDGNDDIDPDDAFFPSGLGHGRGKPIPASPVLPSFSSWMTTINPSAGRGGGRTSQQQPDRPSEFQGFQPKTPIFFSREDTEKAHFSDPGQSSEEGILPPGLLPGLPSAGRGKPPNSSLSPNERIGSEENRHISSRRRGAAVGLQDRSSPSPPRLSREEAVKKAVGILSRGGGERMEEGENGRR